MANTVIKLKTGKKNTAIQEKALEEAGKFSDKQTKIDGFGKLPRDDKGQPSETVEGLNISKMQYYARKAGNKISKKLIEEYIEREKPTMGKLRDWLEAPFVGNKGGVVTKKTKGFKHGGLAGTGHNDMRKGGLFK